MKSLFITFEGGEGTGKSTQVAFLADNLRKQGTEVIVTREPGGTPEAEKIRNLLVHRDGGGWSPQSETLLFFAARVHHVDNLIRPALAKNAIVICDRFTDSTRAYQCYGHGLPRRLIDGLVTDYLGGFEPDLTFILDIDPAAGLARAQKRLAVSGSEEGRFENLDLAFHQRLRKGFAEIAAAEPHRCRLIDASRSPEMIAQEILTLTLSRAGQEAQNVAV